MNFKFRHIKNRFLLQIVIFLVFVLICSGIFWIYTNSTQKLKVTVNDIGVLKKDIQNLHVRSRQQGSEFENTEATILRLESIEDSLNTFFKIVYIQQALEKNNIQDSLIAALNNYIQSVQYVRLSEGELSTYTQETSETLSSISTNILTKYVHEIDVYLYWSAIELKNFEYRFLTYRDKKAYQNMVNVFENIASNQSIQDSLLSGDEELRSLLENYRTKARTIDNIHDRIGDISMNQGLLYDLQSDFYNLIAAYENFEELVSQKIRKAGRKRLIIFILITLLFSVAYVLLILQFMKKIKLPLLRTVALSKNLAKGKISEIEFDTSVPYEFSFLNKNLNDIYQAIKGKKVFVDSLLKQKFDVDLSLQGRGDTFGKTLLALKENMRKAREEQLKHSEENRLRRYLNEGIANFASILRSNSDNLDKLSDIFIRELVKYLEAVQGGLFLINEDDDDELKLTGAFAYNRKKYLEKTIKKGMGLVGTCALEMKSINLTEIPEDYIEITSGLGDALPTNLLLLPVMHEEKLIGVIELASLKEFKEHQIEVGENIASSLASTIINTKVNAHTSQLLAKSQQQAAEMAEQEEEMRQNMEELKATQEESARREEELEGFLNAINQSFFVLEYDTGGIIKTANQKICGFLKLPSDKILGKTHNELFGKGAKADNLLFANVSEGNTVELIEKIILNNKPVEISNTFSPIKSKEGNTVRILNIMTVNFK